MPPVDVHRVAEFLNVTPRRVQQLVKEGMPRGARGEYDPIKCGTWYVRYLQAAIEKRTILSDDEGYITWKEERKRLLQAKVGLNELKLAMMRGEVVPIADVEKEMTELVLTTKARFLAIPARIAPELVGENSRVMIQAKIDKACTEALEPLTKRTPSKTLPAVRY